MVEVADQPDGHLLVSLREVLRLPADKHGKRFRLILDEIDGLHAVPNVQSIEVKINNGRDDIGRYIKHPGTGEPLRIEVSRRRNDRMELTFAHEIGHFLEGALIPGSAFGMRNWAADEVTQDWQFAVKSTDSFRRLEHIANIGQIEVIGSGGVIRSQAVAPQYVSYLMQLQELWARSYAQYVATRRRNGVLLEQIHPRCFPQSAYPIQWNDDEFEPVARSVEILLDRIGWRR